MEPATPSVVPVWCGLFVLLAFVVLGVVYIYVWQRRRQLEGVQFFRQNVADEDKVIAPCLLQCDKYFELKDSIYNKWIVTFKKEFDETPEAKEIDPLHKSYNERFEQAVNDAYPWVRKLSTEDLNTLKVALVHRGVACCYCLNATRDQRTQKWKLYMKGLISESVWTAADQRYSVLIENFEDVKVEAEEMVLGWGGTILGETHAFYSRHQMAMEQKKKEEENKKDEERQERVRKNEELHRRRLEEDKAEAQERKAKKLADKLIQEEMQRKAKKGK